MRARSLWLSLARALAIGLAVCFAAVFTLPLVAMTIARARSEGR
jgi:hypothetical protein